MLSNEEIFGTLCGIPTVIFICMLMYLLLSWFRTFSPNSLPDEFVLSLLVTTSRKPPLIHQSKCISPCFSAITDIISHSNFLLQSLTIQILSYNSCLELWVSNKHVLSVEIVLVPSSLLLWSKIWYFRCSRSALWRSWLQGLKSCFITNSRYQDEFDSDVQKNFIPCSFY